MPEFVSNEVIYFWTKKGLRHRTGSKALCAPDAHFLQDCSLRMRKQDGEDQLNGKGKSFSQDTIVSEEAALDQRHYEKSCFKTCW